MKRLLAIAIALLPFAAHGSELPDSALRQVQFEQRLNAQVPADAVFRDETGKTVKIGDYLGRKPIILVPGYYGCPMLCTLVSNGLVETLHDLKADAGAQFDILAFSISPSEKPELAAAKKREYVRHYGRTGTANGWHFLTGDEPAIRQVADAIGFHYAYDPAIKQYAHPSGFVVLTPEGKVSRYFFGVDFRARELSDALHTAAANHTGSRISQLFLLCFHYSPVTSKYGNLILYSVRAIGMATLLALGFFVARSLRADRKLTP